MSPKAAASYIEGEPKIGVVPVDPGMTNTSEEKQGKKIVGLNSENSEINEGLVQLDIQNIVLIGLLNELPEHDEKYELHRLLGALLSQSLSATEKLNIIETEYDIPVEESINGSTGVSCRKIHMQNNDIAITEKSVIAFCGRKVYFVQDELRGVCDCQCTNFP